MSTSNLRGSGRPIRFAVRGARYAGEMHSGLKRGSCGDAVQYPGAGSHRRPFRQVEAEIARVGEILGTLGGDCCSAISAPPISSCAGRARFRTYGVTLEDAAHGYWQRLLHHPLAMEWFASASRDDVIDMFELPRREAETSDGLL